MSVYDYKITAFVAESGEIYLEVEHDGKSVLIKQNDFHGNGHLALEAMRLRGMPVIGSKNCTALVEKAAQIDDPQPYPIIETVGWNGNRFADPSGQVYSPDNEPAAKLAIKPLARKCARNGKLAGWKRHVAAKIKGQKILQFCTILVFAAPLLQLCDLFLNFGFEIVGVKGTGKSSALRLASSVAGGAGRGPEGHYYVNFDTTLNALEDAMVVHSDMVLLLDEANLFGMGETARALAAMFKDVAFKLGSGTTKARKGSEGEEKRLLFLSTSNEPLASLIGEHSGGAKAAADRLITIPIPEDRPYGVLDFLPAGYSSPGAFVDAVMSATQNYCGQALPRFLGKLVNDRARDEAGLRRKIAEYMETFRERAGVDNNSGTAKRVAEAFGLVYAAGKLAEEYRAIPRHYNCGPAVMACYQLHLGRALAGLSFADRLERLSRRQDVPHLGKGRAPALTDAEYETGIFIKEGRNGQELLIRADRIERHIPDWKHIRGREEVQSLLISEKSRQQTHRVVSSRHDRIRLFCFSLGEDS